MTSLRALLSTLASQAGLILAMCSKERVGLNGPVLARWFSGISNLLSEKLGTDLSGESEAYNGHFFIRHELRQEVVRTVPLPALGWMHLESLEEAAPGDFAFVSIIGENALVVCESGAIILTQPREHSAFSQRGDPLPTGILDALAEVMTQPDLLIGTPTGALLPLEEAFEVMDESEDMKGAWIRLYTKAEEILVHLIRAWRCTDGTVLADSNHHTKTETEKVSMKEEQLLWV